MDQIAVLIESVCSIRDNDLRLIQGKQVEAPRDAPMIAAVFPDQALSPWGRQAQSIAFFKTPGME